MHSGACSDGGLVLTKGAIREGFRRGALAYDYVDLGSEEIAQKVHSPTCHTHQIASYTNTIKYNTLEGGCKQLLKGGQYRLALHALEQAYHHVSRHNLEEMPI